MTPIDFRWKPHIFDYLDHPVHDILINWHLWWFESLNQWWIGARQHLCTSRLLIFLLCLFSLLFWGDNIIYFRTFAQYLFSLISGFPLVQFTSRTFGNCSWSFPLHRTTCSVAFAAMWCQLSQSRTDIIKWKCRIGFELKSTANEPLFPRDSFFCQNVLYRSRVVVLGDFSVNSLNIGMS